jgi:hypothetical protein
MLKNDEILWQPDANRKAARLAWGGSEGDLAKLWYHSAKALKFIAVSYERPTSRRLEGVSKSPKRKPLGRQTAEALYARLGRSGPARCSRHICRKIKDYFAGRF